MALGIRIPQIPQSCHAEGYTPGDTHHKWMGYVALNTVDMLTCSGKASDTHLATVGVVHDTGLYQRMVFI